MNRKRAIVDASSAIILYKAGLFNRLIQSYCVLMTTSVMSEVTRDGYPGAEFFKDVRRRGSVHVLANSGRVAMPRPNDADLSHLDPGERDTIGCYLDGCADFIIIDDGRGSGFCRDNGLPFINALLFPRVLLLSGGVGVAACEEKTAKITQYGRYSQRIVATGAIMGLRELKPFFP